MSKVHLSYEEYDAAIDMLIEKLKNKNYTCIAPIPRGGYYPAIRISQALSIPIVEKSKIQDNGLVVDDIATTGRSIYNFVKDIDKKIEVACVYQQGEQSVKIEQETIFGQYIPLDQWMVFPDSISANNDKDAEEIVVRFLEYIGENPNRPGLKETPKRVVKMWKELYEGYDMANAPKITTFQNGEDGIACEDMVFDTGTVWSNCEHHTVPFVGNYVFAYVPHPKGKILGLSKIARVARFCAHKLQLQERLVSDIVDMLWDALTKDCEYPPLGMAMSMRSVHTCKTMRGVKMGGDMASTHVRGVFKDNATVRAEFTSFVNAHWAGKEIELS